MAFFTIIVVSYQPGEKLIATLQSVLSQSESDFRIIVKDAGSSDGSVEAARTAVSDARVAWVISPDGGIYDGMNQALLHVKEEERTWICFLNCGDLLADERVLAQVRACILTDQAGAGQGEQLPGIYYGDIVERKTGQRVAANPRMDAFACFRNVPNHQTCFYDAALLRREQFDTNWRVRADYEHFLRCVLREGVRAKATGIVICDYEGGGFSESLEGKKISREEHREIVARYFSRAEIFRYRLYLALTLQPLRKRLAESPRTAGLYHRVRRALFTGD